MTDQTFDLTHDGPVGKQQITNVSRVAFNFRLDNDELDARASAKGSLWPGASTDDRSMYVIPRDLCFSFKRRAGVRGGDGMMTVFSGFAGAGRSGQTLRELIESLSFAGVAGGQGAVYDQTGKNPRFPEFAGILGGLVTMVNSGKERISNGDLVYWDLPDPGTDSIAEHGMRGSKRLTAVLRPYRPGKHKVAANAVKEAIRTPSANDSKTPSGEAAVAFKRFTTQVTLNAFEALLSSGLVKLDEAALGTDQTAERARTRNASQWAAVPIGDREAHVTRVARALGCRNVRDSAGNSKIDMPGMPGTNLRNYTCQLLTADKMLIADEGGFTPTGDKGEIVCNQTSAISDMISGAASAEFFITRRIIMRALTPSGPGKEFDASLDHFMM